MLQTAPCPVYTGSNSVEMLEKLINQFSSFLPAFEFKPTLARFIFLLPARIYSHANIQILMTILGLYRQLQYHHKIPTRLRKQIIETVALTANDDPKGKSVGHINLVEQV